MFQQMDRVWGPVFNLSDNYVLPDWQRFEAEFKEDFPPVSNVELPDLTAAELYEAVQKRGKDKKGGLGGWRTREAQALPLSIVALAAEVFNLIERGGPVAQGHAAGAKSPAAQGRR